MTKKLAIIFLVSILFFSGCATPIGYYKAKDSEGGYSETKMQEGVYSIEFKGNSDTSVQRVLDFAYLRAADLTLKNGYKYFTVSNQKTDRTTTSSSVPETTPLECIGQNCYGNRYTTWRNFTYQAPFTYLMVECHKELPANASGTVFDASQVKANVQTQYHINPDKPDAQIVASPKPA